MKSDVPPVIDDARTECHAGITPAALHGILIVAIRDAFDRGQLFDQRLQKELAASAARLRVIGQTEFKPELVHRSPLIVVAIGDRRPDQPGGPISPVSDLRGSRSIQTIWTAAEAVHVVAGNETEADRISFEVARQLISQLPILSAGLGTLRAQVKAIRAPTSVERDVLKSASVVDVEWSWGEHIEIREIGRETAEIAVDVRAENLGITARAM